MSSELLELRTLAVCAQDNDFALLREGATLVSLPLDLAEANSVPKACMQLAERAVDLVLMDGALSLADRAIITKAARESGGSAFIVLMCEPTSEAATTSCADATTAKPCDADAARAMIDGCVRSRLPKRVLVVDDSATMRSIVKKILGASGFRITLEDASEGQVAIDMLRAKAADIVFLDYHMPGLDGVETLKAIKRDNPDMRAVIMTSLDDQTAPALARDAGADAFLRKPFYPADVDAVIYGLFGLTPILPSGA